MRESNKTAFFMAAAFFFCFLAVFPLSTQGVNVDPLGGFSLGMFPRRYSLAERSKASHSPVSLYEVGKRIFYPWKSPTEENSAQATENDQNSANPVTKLEEKIKNSEDEERATSLPQTAESPTTPASNEDEHTQVSAESRNPSHPPPSSSSASTHTLNNSGNGGESEESSKLSNVPEMSSLKKLFQFDDFSDEDWKKSMKEMKLDEKFSHPEEMKKEVRSFIKSPLFKQYLEVLSKDENVEKLRQRILLMFNLKDSKLKEVVLQKFPAFEELLNDPAKWKLLVQFYREILIKTRQMILQRLKQQEEKEGI